MLKIIQDLCDFEECQVQAQIEINGKGKTKMNVDIIEKINICIMKISVKTYF